MALVVNTSLTIEDAVARGHDVFSVLLDRWGTANTDRFPPVLGGRPHPSFPYSVQGIALGPRSTVDRAWVSWNTQQSQLGILQVQEAEGMLHCLTHERPLMFTQQASQGTLTQTTPTAPSLMRRAMEQGLLYVFPSLGSSIDPTDANSTIVLASTLIPPQYFKYDGQLVSFPDLNDPSVRLWAVPPMLELQFVLKPNVFPPAGKRMPLIIRNLIKNGVGPTMPADTETLIGAYPTFGRKTVVIGLSSSERDTVFRVAALRGICDIQNRPGSTDLDYVPQETTEGEKTAPDVDVSVRFQLCDPCADYVLIYAAPPVNSSTARINFAAYD